jgi:ABC-2 type transport system permease protein
MGILISIGAKNQLLSGQVAMLTTFLPAFLLSGCIFTIANMPPVIQWITYLVPARYFVSVLKGIYSKGIGLEILAGQILLLIAYAAGILLLAHVSFRKRLE